MGDEPGILDVELKRVNVDAGMAAQHPDLKIGPYIDLVVTDTGCGISPETLAHIFEPFFTTKGTGEGTGMGLSVVHGIVQGLGGTITVYSEPGHGTTFHVYLPMSAGSEKVMPHEEEPVARGTESVLFVDDEESIAELAKLLLESLGYKVVTMTSSTDALELVRQDPSRFDLIITDQTMPKMTGLSLVREVHKLRPGLPTILSTGFSGAALAEKSKALGVRELVVKPFTAHKLGKAIRDALE
jgi:CheY-like chemotaxis protein